VLTCRDCITIITFCVGVSIHRAGRRILRLLRLVRRRDSCWQVWAFDASWPCLSHALCSSPSHGHYYAVVRSFNRWFVFDDSTIQVGAPPPFLPPLCPTHPISRCDLYGPSPSSRNFPSMTSSAPVLPPVFLRTLRARCLLRRLSIFTLYRTSLSRSLRLDFTPFVVLAGVGFAVSGSSLSRRVTSSASSAGRPCSSATRLTRLTCYSTKRAR